MMYNRIFLEWIMINSSNYLLIFIKKNTINYY